MEIKELKNCKLLEDAVSPVQSRRHSAQSLDIECGLRVSL